MIGEPPTASVILAWSVALTKFVMLCICGCFFCTAEIIFSNIFNHQEIYQEHEFFFIIPVSIMAIIVPPRELTRNGMT